MSRREQDALLALFNSFRPSRRVTAFDQLADAKVLMEVMHSIDATHFKGGPKAAAAKPSTSSPSDNWVLRMNTLKRLYRLLLSYPLNAPNAQTLAVTTLPEPNFNAVARNPKSPEGSAGLVQICRLCVVVGAMGPANERVIAKIQALDEGAMVELMKTIEGVMATLPQGHEGDDEAKEAEASPLSPPVSALREERDRLLQENDDLRSKYEQMTEQVANLSVQMNEASEARENDRRASLEAARTTTVGISETESLRADLVRAEDGLAETEAALEKQTTLVAELTKTVEELRGTASEVAKLRDQVEEFRQVEERLHKNENVIEKYKKKLEDSAGLRRELRILEEENTVMMDKNAKLEVELRKLSAAKALNDNYRTQVETLEKSTNQQASEFANLTVQLEQAQQALADMERDRDRLRDEIHVHQERIKDLEAPNKQRPISMMGSLDVGDTSLDAELDLTGDENEGLSKTELRRRIRTLEHKLAGVEAPSEDSEKMAALETMLAEAGKGRERYQADYLEANRQMLLTQAKLEHIVTGRGGDETATALALRQKLDEVLEERDHLVKDKQAAEVAHSELVRQLTNVKADLGLVDKDKRSIIASARDEARSENQTYSRQVTHLTDELATLRERDRLHLEEIRHLMMDKIEMQASGIEQGQEALERERRFNDMRASLEAAGIPLASQGPMLDMQERNDKLTTEVATLSEKLKKARAFIKNQDALFRAEEGKRLSATTSEAQKAYEAQITQLKSELSLAKSTALSMDSRYRQEQQLMLAAWHDVGARVVRDHVVAAGLRRPVVQRPAPVAWLSRQRKHQDEALFAK